MQMLNMNCPLLSGFLDCTYGENILYQTYSIHSTKEGKNYKDASRRKKGKLVKNMFSHLFQQIFFTL